MHTLIEESYYPEDGQDISTKFWQAKIQIYPMV